MKNTKTMMLHAAVAALLPVLCAAPAQAGFEWTPPPAAPAIAAPAPEALPPVSAAPADRVEAMELTPIPGAVPEAAPEAARAPQGSLPPVTTPAIERESEALPTPSPEILAAPLPSGPFANVVGFGADIPLALALGQIVPAEFAYSFASNVNPGLKISWDGGKPWNEVLNAALAPHNLRADVAGTAVVVRQGVPARSDAPVNTLATPLGKQSDAGYNTTPRPPADMAPLSASMSAPAVADSATTGEGSGNYPRRTPPRTGLFGSIFTPDEYKGNMAPRPPADTPKVIVRNEVAPEEMSGLNAQIAARPLSADTAAPKAAAAVEPAAPAVTAPLPVQPPAAPIAQRISYADEDMRQRTDILPDRTHSESVRAQASVLDPFQVGFWQADNNANLREVLTGWAAQAGVEVIWDSGYDYKLPASISLHGTFPEAVTRVFDLYGTAEPRPQGKLHPNLPKGPSVLLVENFP